MLSPFSLSGFQTYAHVENQYFQSSGGIYTASDRAYIPAVDHIYGHASASLGVLLPYRDDRSFILPSISISSHMDIFSIGAPGSIEIVEKARPDNPRHVSHRATFPPHTDLLELYPQTPARCTDRTRLRGNARWEDGRMLSGRL